MSTVTTQTLVKKLTEGAVSFKFKKVDGTIRNATGTLKSDLIPADARTSAETNVEAPTIAYYDLEANGWRSFQRDAVIA